MMLLTECPLLNDIYNITRKRTSNVHSLHQQEKISKIRRKNMETTVTATAVNIVNNENRANRPAFCHRTAGWKKILPIAIGKMIHCLPTNN